MHFEGVIPDCVRSLNPRLGEFVAAQRSVVNLGRYRVVRACSHIVRLLLKDSFEFVKLNFRVV